MVPPATSSYRFVSAGAPLVLLVAGGALLLAQFTKGTVEARDLRVKSQSERAFNIAEEHAKITRKFGGDSADYVIKRIPRRDED